MDGPAAARRRPDVLLVSVGATTGWRAAARELSLALESAGAAVATAHAGTVPEVRTFMLTDFVQASASRRAARRAIAQLQPRAIVYCSMTAALRWPRPGAIWLDTLAAENRPGRHGLWQRAVEARRAAQAPLLMTMAPGSLAPLNGRSHADAVLVPVAVQSSGPATGPRDIDVLAYAADPVKRRLDFIVQAWQRARREDETLLVAGIDQDRTPWRGRPPAGVRFLGRLAPDAYRELLRRTRVFVAAPRREDFGIAQLEALADGAMLVTTPAPGPYVALDMARRLDSRLVGEDLAPALRAALDTPVAGYAQRAAGMVAPFTRDAVSQTLSQHVLPRLLPGFSS